VNQNFIAADVSLQRNQGLAIDAAHIYWIGIPPSGGGGVSSIRRADIVDGSNIIIHSVDSTELRGIAVDAGHVYWANQGDEAIGRADLDLENPENNFIPVAGKPKGLATDVTASHLYWSLNGESVPNPGNDLYLYEAENEALEDLTADPDEVNGAEVKGVLGASRRAGDGGQLPRHGGSRERPVQPLPAGGSRAGRLDDELHHPPRCGGQRG